MSKRIGLDLDGVMYEWEKTARYMLREIYPKRGEFTQQQVKALNMPFQTWDHLTDNDMGKEPEDWLWTEGVRLGLFRYGHVVQGAVKGVRELAAKHPVIVVTHRPANAVEDTLSWLSFMKLPLRGIHILSNNESKLIADADIYIDDKPATIAEVEAHGGKVGLLFDRPWNKAPARGYRMYGWNQIPSAVDEITRNWEYYSRRAS